MVQIQPFGDRVTVEILVLEQIIGGLVVPSSKEKSNRGLVVAIGDGENLGNIAVGDTVVFQLGAGLSYSTEDKDYKVLNIRDIVGKIVEENK